MAVHPLPQAPRRTLAPPTPVAIPVRPKPRRRWRIALLGLAVAAATTGGWVLLRPTDVQVAVVGRGEAVDAVYASGVVEYVRQARIAPVVTAPIRSVLVREGETVRRGQVLAQLDEGPQAATALQLEAQAAQARAAADRQQRLFSAGFAAKAALDDADAQRRAAEAAAQSARLRLRDYRLSAPFAGRILRRDAEPGDLASAVTPMFVLADPHSLRVTADVDERDMARIAVGMDAAVRADAFPDRTFPARVTQVTPQGDATGRVFSVRLSLPADTPLRPGMTVETNLIAARRPDATLAPTAALRDGAVFVVQHGKAHRRTVTTGAAGPQKTEIVRGLAPGEQVVVNPPANLRDNARVRGRAG